MGDEPRRVVALMVWSWWRAREVILIEELEERRPRCKRAAVATSKPLLLPGDDPKTESIAGLDDSSVPANCVLKSIDDIAGSMDELAWRLTAVEVDELVVESISHRQIFRCLECLSEASSPPRSCCRRFTMSSSAALHACKVELDDPDDPSSRDEPACCDNASELFSGVTRGDIGLSIDTLSSFESSFERMPRSNESRLLDRSILPCVTLSESLSVPDLSAPVTPVVKNFGTPVKVCLTGPNSVLLAPDLFPLSSDSPGLPREGGGCRVLEAWLLALPSRKFERVD